MTSPRRWRPGRSLEFGAVSLDGLTGSGSGSVGHDSDALGAGMQFDFTDDDESARRSALLVDGPFTTSCSDPSLGH